MYSYRHIHNVYACGGAGREWSLLLLEDLKTDTSLVMERDRIRIGAVPMVHSKRHGSPGGI